jgi:hypothetical protein
MKPTQAITFSSFALTPRPPRGWRRYSAATPFVEGWAHYAEQMMVDEGLRCEPLTNSDAGGEGQGGQVPAGANGRGVVADMPAVRFDSDALPGHERRGGYQVLPGQLLLRGKDPARQEAIRGAYDPEFLYYTLGKLEILKLREDYRKQEGTKFSLLEFDNEMLRHGAPPIRLLREVMLKDRALWEQAL